MSKASIPFFLTNIGLSTAYVDASINLSITHFQIGSGNRTPDGSETSLISPREYAVLSEHFKITNQQHRIGGSISSSDLSYNVSEIGLWAGDPSLSSSVLVFYWSKPTGYVAVKSVGINFNFETDLYFGGIVPENITIIADTQFNALSMIAAHEAKVDPHPQYNIANATESIAGKIELATISEAKDGVDTVRAITPAALHAVIDDALDSLPSDKYLQGLSSYNASTNVMKLAMSDGSTVNVDMTALVSDAMPDLSGYAPISSIGNYHGLVQYNSAVNLTAADCGRPFLAGSKGSIFHLPPLNTCTPGSVIKIASQGGNSAIYPSGEDAIFGGSINWPSVPLAGWEYVEFISRPTAWIIIGGSILSGALGVSQSHQELTESRALSSTYTNTTGRPIVIKVSVQLSTGNAMGLYIDGALQSEVSGNYTNPIFQSLVDIVPYGKSYQVAPVLGSGVLLKWTELR